MGYELKDGVLNLNRRLEEPGIHLEITLKVVVDFPGMTMAEFIEKMDQYSDSGLDSLDAGDAAGQALYAYIAGDFTENIVDSDTSFDWTGTDAEELKVGLREEPRGSGNYTAIKLGTD